MLKVLSNRRFARLFAAQVIALLGTGLLTVALGLIAWDIARGQAGAVLGLIFTVKMIAYVFLSPVFAALVARAPRRAVLVGADLVRAAAALCLPFVDSIGAVLGLVFVLQCASATFTPAFQAVIPDILPDEADYTRALSLSRLAYDLESLVSPALAGLLLLVLSYSNLFVGTTLGFLASAALVLGTRLPDRGTGTERPFRERLLRGLRIYLATPRLRGLFCLNFAASWAGAFVLVNTVVVVRQSLGGDDAAVALALAAFGAGSMVCALGLPTLLTQSTDRMVMLVGAVSLAAACGAAAALTWSWQILLAWWCLTGAAYAAILTPAGRLLRRSAHPEDRPAVFAAQFALSHAGWLVAYPAMGWAGATLGLRPALVLAMVGAGAAVAAALALWPRQPATIPHTHEDLPLDHPHLAGSPTRTHSHAIIIDDEHRVWPSQG